MYVHAEVLDVDNIQLYGGVIMETDKKEIARQAYDIIRTSADSNIMMQGISGIFGFPWNLAADGASVFTHYIPMLSKIRTLYSRSQLTDNTLKPLITGIMSEILFDLLIDKGLGSIPIIGVYFNIICAKAMTWRLGILFSMLSARGEVIDRDGIAGAVKVIRLMLDRKSVV